MYKQLGTGGYVPLYVHKQLGTGGYVPLYVHRNVHKQLGTGGYAQEGMYLYMYINNYGMYFICT